MREKDNRGEKNIKWVNIKLPGPARFWRQVSLSSGCYRQYLTPGVCSFVVMTVSSMFLLKTSMLQFLYHNLVPYELGLSNARCSGAGDISLLAFWSISLSKSSIWMEIFGLPRHFVAGENKTVCLHS